MPANGDNKPKLQKMINSFYNKAVAAADNDTNIGIMISTIALLDIFVSIVILALCLLRAFNDQPLDYWFAFYNVVGMVISIAYLTRKIKNVPDNH